MALGVWQRGLMTPDGGCRCGIGPMKAYEVPWVGGKDQDTDMTLRQF